MVLMFKDKEVVKIKGTKSYVDIEYNGRIARFWGDLCLHGFRAIANTMEWVFPHKEGTVTEDERNTFIAEVKKFCNKGKNKVIFIDKK